MRREIGVHLGKNVFYTSYVPEVSPFLSALSAVDKLGFLWVILTSCYS